jgi:hypothetical protein
MPFTTNPHSREVAFKTAGHIPRSVLELRHDEATAPASQLPCLQTARAKHSPRHRCALTYQSLSVGANVDLMPILSRKMMIIPRPEMAVVNVEHTLRRKIHFVSLQNVA